MLRLMLLRHAKATPYTGRDDYERSLTDRGRSDAALIAGYLGKHELEPDLLLHSGAARTKETAGIVLRQLPAEIEVSIDTNIYEANRSTLMDVVQDLPGDSATVMLVGHNPGMADVARHLVGRGEAEAIARMTQKFPTSGLAVIEFPGHSWNSIRPQSGKLIAFVTPSTLGGEDA
jgi:phosphohistidine phosphatase